MHIDNIKKIVRVFYPFAKERLGFEKPVKIIYIINDVKNSEDPLGKTAYYEPHKATITLFTLNRHPKDILRSCAHELTHHAQYCRGDFDNHNIITHEGYAQDNHHMRKMEEEAYMLGGMLPRDFTDMLKKKDEKILIMITENQLVELQDEETVHKEAKQALKRLKDEKNIVDMFEDKRNKLNKKLIDKFIKTENKEGK